MMSERTTEQRPAARGRRPTLQATGTERRYEPISKTPDEARACTAAMRDPVATGWLGSRVLRFSGYRRSPAPLLDHP